MASVYYLLDDALHIADDIVEKYSHQDKNVKGNYLAAVIIQRSYRGYVARKEYKKTRLAAITIQKYIKGWLVRYHLPDILQEYYDRICLDHYNKMATKIQACWRGILVRNEINIKEIFSKKKLGEEKRENSEEITLADTDETDQKIEKGRPKANIEEYSKELAMEDFYKEKIIDILFDRHHLLSTKIRKGILQNHEELTEIEKIMAKMPWKDYMRKQKQIYNKFYKKEKNGKYIYRFEEPNLKHQEDLLRQRDKTKDKIEVTSNNILNKRKPFILNPKTVPEPYERNLLKQDKYYVQNTIIVRSEDKSKNICEKDFHLTLKNIIKESNVPSFYADFWYKECFAHNLTQI